MACGGREEMEWETHFEDKLTVRYRMMRHMSLCIKDENLLTLALELGYLAGRFPQRRHG